MFFTRRVGGVTDGVAVQSIGGVRLTGTVCVMKLGIVAVKTDEVKNFTDQNSYAVLRLIEELPNGTHIGGMYTALDHKGHDGYINQSYAIDAQLGIGELNKIIAFFI